MKGLGKTKKNRNLFSFLKPIKKSSTMKKRNSKSTSLSPTSKYYKKRQEVLVSLKNTIDVLAEEAKVFKKNPTASKKNMDVVQIKNLNTGKVSEAFVLTNAKDGKGQLLYAQNNKPVGRSSQSK